MSVKAVVALLFTVTLGVGLMLPLALPLLTAEPTVQVRIGAAQLAVPVPVAFGEQLHAHGPVPVTVVAVPVLHRLALGAAMAGTPLTAPQVPLIGVRVNAATTLQLPVTAAVVYMLPASVPLPQPEAVPIA